MTAPRPTTAAPSHRRTTHKSASRQSLNALDSGNRKGKRGKPAPAAEKVERDVTGMMNDQTWWVDEE
ncbi:hypothetical protein HK104_009636, partial [Borealophlyctis nickersoniae]